MKGMLFGAVTLISAPLIANASCETLKASIVAKLEAKHVENYTLDVRNAADPGDGKIIGHCEGDTKVVVYRRSAAGSHAAKKRAPDQAD